jgi:eukaryotic-like serine/threonine-protein kinase
MIHETVALVPYIDARLGTTLGERYRIERVVGEGGMATVYEVRQLATARTLAAKMLNPAMLSDSKMVERFRREAKHCARLAHPNIVEVFEYDTTAQGVPYMIMELLRGEPLDARVERGGLTIDFALKILVQVVRAVARAHDMNVVHRDLKPENIFLSIASDGSPMVKVIDFGISRALTDGRLTGQGELFGTPQYMSPGRIKGLETCASDDLYALGVIMYELLTGQLPFEATDVGNFFMKHLTEVPQPPINLRPDLPAALSVLIVALLAKDPAKRPVDAHSVEQVLLAISDERALYVPRTTDLENADGPVTVAAQASALCSCIDTVEAVLRGEYGSVETAPAATLEALEALRSKVSLLTLAERSFWSADTELIELERQGRENRHRIGFAIDAQGVEASTAKQALRAAREKRDTIADGERTLQAEFTQKHRDMLQLEGRFAFQSPSVALAEAYREAASILDAWRERGLAIRECDEQFESQRALSEDLEFQVEALRKALHEQEERYEQTRTEATRKLAELARARDALEVAVKADLATLLTPLKEKGGAQLRSLEALTKTAPPSEAAS